jgi:hypothetical protein
MGSSSRESSSGTAVKEYRLSPRANSFMYERPHKAQQLRRLLAACLSRWIITLALCAAIYLVLWQYSSKTTMVKKKKKEFNTLIVGLSIMLSLNIASALKHMMGTLRWWLLSLREWRPREVDIILQSDNLSRMLQLLVLSRRNSLRFYVILCLTINVVSAGSGTSNLRDAKPHSSVCQLTPIQGCSDWSRLLGPDLQCQWRRQDCPHGPRDGDYSRLD